MIIDNGAALISNTNRLIIIFQSFLSNEAIFDLDERKRVMIQTLLLLD